MTTRREFIRRIGMTSLASAAGYPADLVAAEPPPETARLRLHKTTSLCNVSLYVAEELLRAEGFTEIQYVGNQESTTGVPGARSLAAGEFDIGQNFAAPAAVALDAERTESMIGHWTVACRPTLPTKRPVLLLRIAARRLHDWRGFSARSLR